MPFPEEPVTVAEEPKTAAAGAGRQTGTQPPKLAADTELIGDYGGSGFKEPPSLVRRSDGQVIQLSELLYLVAKFSDGSRSYDDVAQEVSREYGKGVSGDNVRTLVEDKLRPLGVMTLEDGSSPELKKPDPLLALKFRKQLIPERWSRAASAPFKPLFWPPVALAALVGFVLFDIWLFGHHGVAQGMRQAMYQPALMVVLFGMVVLSAAWHEFGHAAGCSYGGAKPGGMGAGIYLAYPAFYTDVTDSYRLSRTGRLRTDLAGVYFNILFVLATAGLYFLTHWEPLLLLVVIQHIEMAHQLLPFLRLDGYYIVSDLTGVPDLFARIGPILSSMVPFRRQSDKVKQLKPWVRVVVTLWVVIVVPLLLFQLGMLMINLPRILGTAWDSLQAQWHTVSKDFGNSNVFGGVGAGAQSLILLLPILGIFLTFGRLFGRVGKGGWRKTEGRPVARSAFVLAGVALVGGLAYVWMPNGDYEPIHKGERGTLAEGVHSIAAVRSGRPGLVTRDRAAERNELDERTDTTPTTTPSLGDLTTPRETTTTLERSNVTPPRPTTTTTQPSNGG
jgi:putative peptide zinc metalloprotease protein